MKTFLHRAKIFLIGSYIVQGVILIGSANLAYADTGECKGVKLNTDVPFIGKCIEYQSSEANGNTNANTTVVTTQNAFPVLVGGLSKLVLTTILIVSFLLLVIAGVAMTADDASAGSLGKGKAIIMRVAIGIALLGASGIILYLINPNFFK